MTEYKKGNIVKYKIAALLVIKRWRYSARPGVPSYYIDIQPISLDEYGKIAEQDHDEWLDELAEPSPNSKTGQILAILPAPSGENYCIFQECKCDDAECLHQVGYHFEGSTDPMDVPELVEGYFWCCPKERSKKKESEKGEKKE